MTTTENRAEPRQARVPRAASSPADVVTLTMSNDEADAKSVLIVEALAAWKAQSEQTHSAQLNAMHFRALTNMVAQIREQLPESYPTLQS